VSCHVVGVLSSKGATAIGSDQDDQVLLPLSAFQRRVAGNDQVDTIAISTKSERLLPKLKRRVESLLRERRRILPEQASDFSVQDLREIAKTLQGVTGTLAGLLGVIAGVSLVVGGIGIMNIMLVSVTERTREIGIRLACGAAAGDILVQFLLESVALSLIGGVVGVVLGLAGSWVACLLLEFPFRFLPETALIAFAFSLATGVLFGVVPARHASRLNPVDALRSD
jgi:putative ABC transport system permease protein